MEARGASSGKCFGGLIKAGKYTYFLHLDPLIKHKTPAPPVDFGSPCLPGQTNRKSSGHERTALGILKKLHPKWKEIPSAPVTLSIREEEEEREGV